MEVVYNHSGFGNFFGHMLSIRPDNFTAPDFLKEKEEVYEYITESKFKIVISNIFASHPETLVKDCFKSSTASSMSKKKFIKEYAISGSELNPLFPRVVAISHLILKE